MRLIMPNMSTQERSSFTCASMKLTFDLRQSEEVINKGTDREISWTFCADNGTRSLPPAGSMFLPGS